MTPSRTLGRSGLRVSALGLGCWPIGGAMYLQGRADHYGQIDAAEAIRAIHAAIDEGVTLFDTADCYGAGHSETLLGEALVGRRDQIVVATKFGYTFDSRTKHLGAEDVSPEYIRRACHASLRRLQTDRIDLYQIHCGGVPAALIGDVITTLEALCDDGLIRSYGWSTDDPAMVQTALAGGRFATVQHEFNLLTPADATLDLCRRQRLGSIGRSPLAMGLLGGRYHGGTHFGSDDVRGAGYAWVRFFRDSRPAPEFLRQLDAVRELLTQGGRTVAQGALGYVWAKSEITVPIPGFKSVVQAVENARAIAFGALDPASVDAIDARLRAMAVAGGGAPAARPGES